MHLDWLTDFLALANTRNFSSAANARNITQSAFSRRIQALEHWVGVPLVDRSTYPVTLTAAGELFRTSAYDILRNLHYTRDECRAEVRPDRETISFTALHTLATTFFPGWIRRMEVRLGKLQTRMLPHSMHDSVQLLVTGNCTFLLCYCHSSGRMQLDPERYPSLGLAREAILPVVAADPSGQPLYTFSEETAPDQTLAGEMPLPYLAYGPDSILGKFVDSILMAQNQPLHLEVRYQNSMAESLKAMAVEGQGVAWLPESCAADAIAAGNLVAIGNKRHRLEMEVRIFRSASPAKPEAEDLWNLLQENSQPSKECACTEKRDQKGP